MSSNYPPGVTGSEYAIAGPDREVERSLECPACHVTAIQLVEGYRGTEWFDCESCGVQTDIEVPEVDYDRSDEPDDFDPHDGRDGLPGTTGYVEIDPRDAEIGLDTGARFL